MNKRWGISIDIEGFSRLYESSEQDQTRAVAALSELMDSIIKIGRLAYPGDINLNEADRIFAHQFGDGFIIVSNFEEPDASRCIAIATSLMRHMAIKGFYTKAAISTGSMMDIHGCYPDSVRDCGREGVPLGAGVMTTIPVMGTALTKAHKLSSRVSGCLLVVDKSAFEYIPENLIVSCEENCCYIDWRLDENHLARAISNKSELEFGGREQLLELFEQYIVKEPLPPERWIKGSRKSIS